MQVITLLLFLTMALTTRGWAEPDQSTMNRVKKSIVKVFAKFENGSEQVGTGFVMTDPCVIITALHVVAGSTRITIKYEATGAVEEVLDLKVLRSADLVALRVRSEKPMPQLNQSATEPPPAEPITIVGFPLDLETSIESFGKIGYSGKKLSDMLTENQRKEIRDMGYPALTTQVIHIAGNITHGTSGAPVLNKLGEVIGVANGGLENGVHDLNWAMPTSYIAELLLSAETLPGKSNRGNLMFAVTSEPVEKKSITLASPQQYVPEAAFDQSMYDFLLALYGTSLEDQILRQMASSAYTYDSGSSSSEGLSEPTLAFVKRRSLGEIYATCDDQVNLNAMLQNFTTNTWQDPYTMEFDIYEDYYSGATVVTPAGMQLTANGDVATGEWYDGEIVYICQLRWSATTEDAIQQSLAFESMIAPDDGESYWAPDPAWSYTEPYYRTDGCIIMRKGAYQYNLYSLPIAYGYETLATNGTSFLGTAVGHENMSFTEQWTAEFSYAWAQAMIAVFLSTFEIQG